MKTAEPLTTPPLEENEGYWKYHTQQCVESGLLKSTYCKQQDVNYPRFIYWSKKLTEQALPKAVAIKIRPKNKSMNKFTQQKKSLIAVQIAPSNKSLKEVLCTLRFNQCTDLQVHTLEALSFILERMR